MHGHSAGVYPVPFRTRKSSPVASVSVLWCESPWEQRSLCPSPFTSDLIPVSSIVPSAKRMDLGQVSEGALNGDRGA